MDKQNLYSMSIILHCICISGASEYPTENFLLNTNQSIHASPCKVSYADKNEKELDSSIFTQFCLFFKKRIEINMSQTIKKSKCLNAYLKRDKIVINLSSTLICY